MMAKHWGGRLATTGRRRVLLLHQQQSTRSFASTPSFFSYTSVRGRKRRRRWERLQEQSPADVVVPVVKPKKQQKRQGKQQQADTRTVTDILFPNPYANEPDPLAFATGKGLSFLQMRTVLYKAVVAYRDSWKGFFTSRGLLVEDEDEIKQKAEAAAKAANKTSTDKEKTSPMTLDAIQENAKTNFSTLRDDAEFIKKEVSDRTGVHTTDDLKRIAEDMLRLATDCVQDFMNGYRKGRDDQIDRMLELTLEDEEKEKKVEEQVKRKRRPKRRVLRRVI